MRRIRWRAVILGVLTTVALTLLSLTFVSVVAGPFLSAVTGTAPVDGVTSVTVVEERVQGLLLGVCVLLSLFFAFFAGGAVSGRFSVSSPGLNGAVMGVGVVAVPFLWLVGSLVSVFLAPVTGEGDAVTRSEGLRMLVAALVVCSVASPVAVSTGFWGGRTGGRPRGAGS